MLSLFLNAKSPAPAYQYMPVRGVRMRRISEIFLYSLIVYSCEERNIAKTLLFQTATRIVYCFAKVPISSRNQHPPRLAILESTFIFSMPSAPKSVKIVFAFSPSPNAAISCKMRFCAAPQCHTPLRQPTPCAQQPCRLLVHRRKWLPA